MREGLVLSLLDSPFVPGTPLYAIVCSVPLYQARHPYAITAPLYQLGHVRSYPSVAVCHVRYLYSVCPYDSPGTVLSTAVELVPVLKSRRAYASVPEIVYGTSLLRLWPVPGTDCYRPMRLSGTNAV
eukprot:777982-Rhodomonas_salina.1